MMFMNAPTKRISICLLVLFSITCSAPFQLASTLMAPTPVIKQTESGTSSAFPDPPTPSTPTLPAAIGLLPTETIKTSATSENLPVQAGDTCSYNPITAQLLEGATQEQWIEWVSMLSGAEPVTIDGKETRIETRYSPALFNAQANARAFDWLLDTVSQWYPAEQIEVQPFQVEFEDQRLTWKNLIITLPGQTHPDEIVVLSAHLDSTSSQPYRLAPGAEDNASGSATLLEAARLFRTARFERTLKIVWFTGEEQGLWGSEAFVEEALANRQQITGVVNLDMFGYDSDDDRCFELHVGELPESRVISDCFQTTIASYQPALKVDILITEAIDRSDHGSFWEAGIGAVEVLENLFDNKQPTGCSNRDPSPNYHTDQDIVSNLNPASAYAIARISLATTIGLARPVDR